MPVLSGTIPSFELFMMEWELLGKNYSKLKPWTEIGLTWAKKYYQRMDNTRAYIIALRKFISFLNLFSLDNFRHSY